MIKNVSCQFFLVFFLLLFSSSVFAYDKSCNDKIKAQSYLVSGSIESSTSGGKVYNFQKILNSLESELYVGEVDEEKVTCLNDLFRKAHSDATDYWVDRMVRGNCVDEDGAIPSVKPNGCPEGTWKEFQRSMDLLTRSENRYLKIPGSCSDTPTDKATAECTQRDANQLFATADGIAKSAQEDCCNPESGSAFRVLRSTYTFSAFGGDSDFSNTSDSDLQKECLKRTDPKASGSFGNHASSCLSGLLDGLLGRISTYLHSISNLYDAVFGTDAIKVLAKKLMTDEGRQEISDSIFSLLEEIGKQISAQFNSTLFCFSGPYKTEQICHLAGGILIDAAAGGMIGKVIGFLAKGVGSLANFAGEIISKSKSASALATKTKSLVAKTNSSVRATTKVATEPVKKVLKTTGRIATSPFRLAKKLISKPFIGIKNAVSKGTKALAQKLKRDGKVPKREIASEKGPNGQQSVAIKEQSIGSGFEDPVSPPVKIAEKPPRLSTKKAEEVKPEIKSTSPETKPVVNSEVKQRAPPRINLAKSIARSSGASRSAGPTVRQRITSFVTKKSSTTAPKPVEWNQFSSSTVSLPTSLKAPSAINEAALTQLSSFTSKVQAAAASQDSTALSQSFGAGKNWSRTVEATRQHQNVQRLLASGDIDQATANSIHTIIQQAEEVALRPTIYTPSTTYVVAPNTNPSTFGSIISTGTKALISSPSAEGVMTLGPAVSASNFKEMPTQSFNDDTIDESTKALDAMPQTIDEVAKKFQSFRDAKSLEKEADRMILHAKVVKSYFLRMKLNEKADEIQDTIDLLLAEKEMALDSLRAPASE